MRDMTSDEAHVQCPKLDHLGLHVLLRYSIFSLLEFIKTEMYRVQSSAHTWACPTTEEVPITAQGSRKTGRHCFQSSQGGLVITRHVMPCLHLIQGFKLLHENTVTLSRWARYGNHALHLSGCRSSHPQTQWCSWVRCSQALHSAKTVGRAEAGV